ncbi:MAG: type IV toxin-antitoxin system AbiEi family antitoxin domain-containing protein, partial [Lapillicoccus sp.]
MTEDALARWTGTQHGLVTRRQCLRLGLSAKAVAWRLDSGRWVAAYPGVFQTMPGRSDWLSRAGAAVLVSGEGAVLSHASAAQTFGLDAARSVDTDLVTISVPAHRRVTDREGIRVVRRRVVIAHDETLWPPRTTVEETVLDLADETDADGALALFAEALRRGVTWDVALTAALGRRRAHRWKGLLLEAMADLGEGVESTFEVRFVRDVERAHGLPAGRRQQATGAGRRHHDSGYAGVKVLVELDGRAWHEGLPRERRDARRDLATLTEGWVTVRAGWADVAVTPC